MSFPLRTFPNPFCQAQPTSSFHLPSASTMPCMASDTLGLMRLPLPPLGSPYWGWREGKSQAGCCVLISSQACSLGSEGWGQRQHLQLCCACELWPFALHKGHWWGCYPMGEGSGVQGVWSLGPWRADTDPASQESWNCNGRRELGSLRDRAPFPGNGREQGLPSPLLGAKLLRYFTVLVRHAGNGFLDEGLAQIYQPGRAGIPTICEPMACAVWQKRSKVISLPPGNSS